MSDINHTNAVTNMNINYDNINYNNNNYNKMSQNKMRQRADKWARTHAPCDQWRQRLLKTCVERMKQTRTHTVDERRRMRMRIVAEAVDNNNSSGVRARGRGLGLGLGIGEMEQGGHAGVQDQEELVALLEDLEAAAHAEQTQTDGALQALLESLTQDADEDVAQLAHFHDSMTSGRQQQQQQHPHGASHPDSGQHASSPSSAMEDAVVCPVCANGRVCVEDGVVWCRCGLRVESGTCDNVTLPMLRDRLAQVFAQHQTACTSRLGFGVRHTFGQFLWASCAACRLECIVF